MTSFNDTYKRVTPFTVLDDDKTYVVVARYKDNDGDPFVKFTGTYDECDDYAQRNESEDNVEAYYVAEKVA